jgi:hypothetical protein
LSIKGILSSAFFIGNLDKKYKFRFYVYKEKIMLDLPEEKTLEFQELIRNFIESNTDLKFICTHEANTDTKGVYRCSFFVGTKEHCMNPNFAYIDELKRYYEGQPGW